MDIKSVSSLIPEKIASLYSHIFLIDEKNNEYYQIRYTGEKLSVSVPLKLSELEEILSDIKNFQLREVLKHKGVQIFKKEKEEVIVVVEKVDAIDLLLIEPIHKQERMDNKEKDVILIADDSPVITNFFKKVLEDEYEILVATNGDEVIEAVLDDSSSIKGIFLDLNMPVKSGFEVLDYFNEHNLFVKYPVSVITGEDSKDSISKVTKYAIVDVLQKPFSKEAAKTIVSKTLQANEK